MAIPTTRAEFKENVLRRLGKGVICQEVSDDQIEDRLDEAIAYYHDYHFDGSEKIYYKHLVQEENRPDRVYQVTVNDGGTGYANSDTVVFTPTGPGTGATANVVTDGTGIITSITMTAPGSAYAVAPAVSVTTGGGSGADLEAELGGFILLPDNVFGAVRLFRIADAIASSNMFSIRYQIALNDLYRLTNVSMVPYFQAFQHIRLLEELLVGRQPIRFNRHRNKLYVDMDWVEINDDEFLVVEAYQVLDPDKYPDMWKDWWLQRYAEVLVKKQWGWNLFKYQGMQMPGGIQYNADAIYQEAIRQQAELEHEMVHTYSLPVHDFFG